jgi:hypothetical protein
LEVITQVVSTAQWRGLAGMPAIVDTLLPGAAMDPAPKVRTCAWSCIALVPPPLTTDATEDYVIGTAAPTASSDSGTATAASTVYPSATAGLPSTTRGSLDDDVVSRPLLPELKNLQLLLRACGDSSSTVRAALCSVWESYCASPGLKVRCTLSLRYLCLFMTCSAHLCVCVLCQSTAFVPTACKELVKLLQDPVLVVRQKAAWALGNVFTSFEDVGSSRMVASLFSLSDLRSTAAALANGLEDHDKVAVACVRGLGRCIVGLFEMCGEIPPDPLYSELRLPSGSPPPSPHRSLFSADLENASAIIRTIARNTLGGGGVKVPLRTCRPVVGRAIAAKQTSLPTAPLPHVLVTLHFFAVICRFAAPVERLPLPGSDSALVL